ncbi:septum formation family protein [Cryobacterium sp. SO2]|uniref:septum formation family protein n=1 Tax=Cryobacterium sp. SO2 TaxID=1897060 RepID=UPI00223D1985|nr:septum formation family protein [Cryobacterium sp. SO2]WEO77389.1 septum formation family protein [Cryobacterium sp. SO2]
MFRTTSRLTVILAAAAFSAGALALSGCSAITDLFPKEAARDADTQEISEAGEADVFSLAVGDCFNDQDAEEIDSVQAIPCSEAHDYEAYFAFDVSAEETYPGDEVISQAAEDGCVAEFPTFVGMSYEESTLDFNYLSPTEGSWENGDHEILCIVMGPEKTTGSLAGVAL